ncbi:hypothetical protein Mgra_00002929 [Meloidogyne graminicola]|uniref:Gem-associated protein 7 n=1 Tax=Meloidogyne graminicola TaxID=189291 RepID=A0A8S9ZVK3_9BILA|nr:hypothetical protein Mgra_00002929 [Meloidogyne graminicola]
MGGLQHSQNFDKETQIANVELRQRFLRFLNWLPNKNVEAKMFGTTLNGIITGVDASNFDHFLFNKLHTPTSLIEHAALRTRDTIYLRIASPHNNEYKNNLNIEKEEVMVDSMQNESSQKKTNYQAEKENNTTNEAITPKDKDSTEINIEDFPDNEVEASSSSGGLTTPLSSTKSEGSKRKRSSTSIADRMARSTTQYLDRIK